jgi:predicted nuclease of restriction endonuclease-like (RecB) superfamily
LTTKKNASQVVVTNDFETLVSSIVEIHRRANEFASKAVNIGLTLRNWLIGHRIVGFEQKGKDRAAYGERLLDSLSERLAKQGLTRSSARELRRYRQFYLVYPRIWESVTPKSLAASGLGALAASRLTATPIRESLTPESAHLASSPDEASQAGHLAADLIEQLSFTHLAELIQLSDDIQRRFYEIESIRGRWSVRELRRQIASLYYERSGLSKNKKELSAMTHRGAETLQPRQIIRDPYIFEFLGLRSRDTMGESDLEDALLDGMQEFLLELGHGFCFEARQKRILIGDEHFYVDLVFYHRVLKCHVLVELKTQAFSHENLGQLNSYVAYYKKHEMTKGDQPPIGILLCTSKNEALVEFALGDLKNSLFVSRYAVEMPDKAAMEKFLQQLGREIANDA